MGKNNFLLGMVGCFCLLLVGAGCSASVDLENQEPEAPAPVEEAMMDASDDHDDGAMMEAGEAMEKEDGDAMEADAGDAMEAGEPSNDAAMEKKEEPADTMVKVDAEVDAEVMKKDEPKEDAVANAVSFNLSGTNFAFSQKELRVKKGSTVTINFTSESGFHDWVVDEFSAATAQVKAGNSSSVTFVADKAGSFEYYCSVGSHRQLGMVGRLIVE